MAFDASEMVDTLARMRAGPARILGYHGIDEVDPRHDPLRLYVGPGKFAAQVRGLQHRGYEFVTMSEFADRMQGRGEPPPGVAALTFDDGTVDHAKVLPAVLSELGVPGTVYVCPGLSGTVYPWTSEEAGVRFMTEAELVETAAHPLVEIGAHTNEHHELHEADAATALDEMTTCKETLEGLLGGEITSFCYPRCHHSAAARDAAERAGYRSAVTCGIRGSWDPFSLKREVFHGNDGPLVSALRMRGRYAGLGTGLAARGVRWSARVLDRLSGSGDEPEPAAS
jgi:peptidoglycan/xylan/chitin deacetylase (PgdA/CDA1 family)